MGRRRLSIAIASPFILLAVILIGVIALPCETMKVIIANESDTWAHVRVGVHHPTRNLWNGKIAAGETRTLSLAAIPMSQFTDIFVSFPELGGDEVSRSEELLIAGYPLGIAIHRFRIAPGRIHSETVFDWWGDRFESKILKDFLFFLEILFVPLRCLDCEVLAWLRR